MAVFPIRTHRTSFAYKAPRGDEMLEISPQSYSHIATASLQRIPITAILQEPPYSSSATTSRYSFSEPHISTQPEPISNHHQTCATPSSPPL